jgi:hypothetical protein
MALVVYFGIKARQHLTGGATAFFPGPSQGILYIWVAESATSCYEGKGHARLWFLEGHLELWPGRVIVAAAWSFIVL